MRPVTRWLLALLAGLVLCAPLPAAKTTEPKVAVVVAAIYGGGETRSKDAARACVIGGYVKGRGWLKSEQAGPLMKKDDRMVLYTLDPPGRRVGEVELTNSGEDLNASGNSNSWGWEFEARVIHSAGDKGVVGIWRTPAAPQPKWVTGKELSSDKVVYRKEVLAWLKSRGVSEAAYRKTKIEQIVKADLNGDKREEVLIFFHSPEACCTNNPEVPSPRYSYLIMRYLPRGSRTARTTVLDDDWYGHPVSSLSDLDGDGWAEIMSSAGCMDYAQEWIYHWNGKAFQAIPGCGGGA